MVLIENDEYSNIDLIEEEENQVDLSKITILEE